MKGLFYMNNKNILRELYFGRVSRWERRINRTAEEMAVENKIQAEKKYFAETMTAEDFRRLRELENLYGEFRGFEDMRTFNFAFSFGVMLMCAVFMGEESEK
jgi:hypothetical protein